MNDIERLEIQHLRQQYEQSVQFFIEVRAALGLSGEATLKQILQTVRYLRKTNDRLQRDNRAS